MKDIKFRDLRADEIDLRVGSTKKDQSGVVSGFQLLLYKDARVDANILDETVGAFNWQKKFYQVKNTMICSLGINMNWQDDTKEPYWVWKDDAGDESETEAIKGEASDSFKRAAFAFGGLGRALYTAPFIWIKCDQDNDPKKSHYSVSEIEYENGKISKLVITNDKTGQVVFSCGSQYKVAKNTVSVPKNTNVALKGDSGETIRQEEKDYIDKYIGRLSREQYDSFFDWLEKSFKVRNVAKLTAEQGIIVVNSLKKRESK